ncbi:hypothetical protein B0H17DRAFT_1326670 [Mycena rosella]|uniref:N-acetyltransferase domain-containing protein n=1 Tax=Mycena rosella TaxID=1033263 RepID=A0AAD7M6N5_MYCRO|nr:hypothetical protein B0H17DRAFT_1326670 [Mycena rosella]
MANFLVRKLDPSTAVSMSDPGSLPEIHNVESVLSKAFTGDRFTAVVTGHGLSETDTSHIGPFWLTTVVAGLLGGEVYVAETNDTERKIIGCAVWFGPGHSLYDTEAQQQHSLVPLMAMFDDKLQHWWHTVFLPTYDNMVASGIGPDTKHNSWHLQTLGVDLQYRRKGAATLLLNTVIKKAKLAGDKLSVELENEVNFALYEGVGFELMPKGKARDECSESFTGITGDTFRMWVLAQDSK